MVMPSLCSRRQASCSPQTQAHSARTPNCFRKQESMPHQKLELSSLPQMLDSTPRTVGWSCFQTQGPTAHRKLALWIQTVGSRTLPATVQKTGTRTDSAEVEWNRIRQTVRQAFVDQTPRMQELLTQPQTPVSQSLQKRPSTCRSRTESSLSALRNPGSCCRMAWHRTDCLLGQCFQMGSESHRTGWKRPVHQKDSDLMPRRGCWIRTSQIPNYPALFKKS